MRRLTRIVLGLGLVFGCAAPASVFAQEGGGEGAATTAEQTDTDEEAESDKNWKVRGSVESRVGQGTFAALENETGIESEYQTNAAAFDRANMIYTFAPSYRWDEFTFGAEFQLVHWLTAGSGIYGYTSSAGANEAADVFFQDISLSAAWDGYTFESIDLNLAPSLELVLPTHKISRLTTKLASLSGSLSLSRTFFERLTLQGSLGATKSFHRYKTAAVDINRVGNENVLFRQGEAEDVGSGLVAIDGYNLSHTFSAGGAAQIKIVEKLSGSVSYFFVNYYSYPGNSEDENTAENAKPDTNLSQAISTSAELSYDVRDWLAVSGGIGTFMSPKTSDNKSFRFPFWNTEGAAANRSWISLGVEGSY